jgi:hypothetical protein
VYQKLYWKLQLVYQKLYWKLQLVYQKLYWKTETRVPEIILKNWNLCTRNYTEKLKLVYQKLYWKTETRVPEIILKNWNLCTRNYTEKLKLEMLHELHIFALSPSTFLIHFPHLEKQTKRMRAGNETEDKSKYDVSNNNSRINYVNELFLKCFKLNLYNWHVFGLWLSHVTTAGRSRLPDLQGRAELSLWMKPQPVFAWL